MPDLLPLTGSLSYGPLAAQANVLAAPPVVGLWDWLAFGAFVIVLLVLDLVVFHRDSREPTLRESAVWTVVWCLIALGLQRPDLVLARRRCGSPIFDRLSGRMDAVDGQRLRLRRHLQLFPRGAEVSIPGAVLGHSGCDRDAAQLRAAGHGADRSIRLGDAAVRAVLGLYRHQVVPAARGRLRSRRTICCGGWPRRCCRWPDGDHGERFFVRQDGRFAITPLFLVLLVVESTDVVFAVDSVPAIFVITQDPFIVFTSNIFAILGLRALYFLLAGVMDLFRYLKYGLAAILVFLGLKMIAEYVAHRFFGIKGPIISPLLSLLIIVVILAVAIAASLKAGPRDEE